MTATWHLKNFIDAIAFSESNMQKRDKWIARTGNFIVQFQFFRLLCCDTLYFTLTQFFCKLFALRQCSYKVNENEINWLYSLYGYKVIAVWDAYILLLTKCQVPMRKR